MSRYPRWDRSCRCSCCFRPGSRVLEIDGTRRSAGLRNRCATHRRRIRELSGGESTNQGHLTINTGCSKSAISWRVPTRGSRFGTSLSIACQAVDWSWMPTSRNDASPHDLETCLATQCLATLEPQARTSFVICRTIRGKVGRGELTWPAGVSICNCITAACCGAEQSREAAKGTKQNVPYSHVPGNKGVDAASLSMSSPPDSKSRAVRI